MADIEFSALPVATAVAGDYLLGAPAGALDAAKRFSMADIAVTGVHMLVYVDGANYVAKNMTVGGQVAVGTNAVVVIQAAIDALTTSRTVIETVKLTGVFSVDAPIDVPSYTRLEMTDAKLLPTAYGAGPYIGCIQNADQVTGNTDIIIEGGDIGPDAAVVASGSNTDGIRLVNATRVIVKNATTRWWTNHGINLDDVTHFRVEGCNCSYNGDDGITVHRKTAYGVIDSNICFNQQNVTGASSGIEIEAEDDSGRPHDIVLSNNICYDDQPTRTQDKGIQINSDNNDAGDDPGSPYNITIIGGIYKGNLTAGIFSGGSATYPIQAITIVGGVCEGNVGLASGGNSVSVSYCEDVVITGLMIKSAKVTSSSAIFIDNSKVALSGITIKTAERGILLTDSEATITSCSMDDIGGYGIFSYETGEHTITGNKISNSGGEAIYLNHTGEGVASNNSIKSCAAYGIRGDCTRFIAENNSLVDVTNYAIRSRLASTTYKRISANRIMAVGTNTGKYGIWVANSYSSITDNVFSNIDNEAGKSTILFDNGHAANNYVEGNRSDLADTNNFNTEAIGVFDATASPATIPHSLCVGSGMLNEQDFRNMAEINVYCPNASITIQRCELESSTLVVTYTGATTGKLCYSIKFNTHHNGA